MRLFYISIILIFVFSCTEREDLLPEVDRDKAYYTDHSPKLEWSAKVSVDDSTYSLIEGKPEIVGDLVLTRIPRKHLLKTYDYHTGNLLWSLNVEQYLGRFGEDNFAALDIGGILHIIDRDDGKVVRLLKESGEVLGSFDPEDHGLRVRGGIEAVVINDFY